MNTRVLRRSSRRHSISTLPNIENRYSKKELSLDVGCALDELRVLNTQTINKRRSSARGLSRNNEYSIYQKEKLQINSSNGIQNEELVKSCPPTVSKSIYDSLMDIEKVLDDIAIPDQRRRSRRISEIEKQRLYSYNTPKNSECRVSIKNQRKSKNSNEVMVAEPVLERRKRKLCEEITSSSIENLCGSKENTEKINEKPYPRKMRKKSVLIDQTTYSPLMTVAFFGGMSLLEGKDLNGAKEEIEQKFLPTYKIGLGYWPIIQTVNFTYISEKNRVPFISLCGMVWTVFLAFMLQTNLPKKDKKNLPKDD